MKSAFISTIDERYAKAVLPLALYKDCEYMQREDDGKWSTYTINNKRLIKVKTSTTKGKRVRFWRFTFDPGEQTYLDKKDKTTEAHLLLICDDIICSLPWREAKQLMADYGKKRQQQLRVVRRRQDDQYTYTVKGSDALNSWKFGKSMNFIPSGLDDVWSELCA